MTGPDGPATGDGDVPPAFARIRADFLELSLPDRLQLLLEFSRELPDLPARFADHPELLERVEECQAPVRAVAEVDADGIVHFYASAPPEAPTTRGFAAVLAEGFAGLTAAQVLAIPGDYPFTLGLGQAVSPLRLHGMTGMLERTKRQVREQTAR